MRHPMKIDWSKVYYVTGGKMYEGKYIAIELDPKTHHKLLGLSWGDQRRFIDTPDLDTSIVYKTGGEAIMAAAAYMKKKIKEAEV